MNLLHFQRKWIAVFICIILSVDVYSQEYSILDSNIVTKEEIRRIDSIVARNPLRPPNTESPRATMISFYDNTLRAYKILRLAYRNDLSKNKLLTDDEVRERARQAEELLERSIKCINLENIPDAFKEDYGYEKALQLKEVLDRIGLPPLDSIPDLKTIRIERETRKAPELHRWKIPNTDIVIIRVEEGESEGDYLFSPESIENLDVDYRKVKALPYRENDFVTPNFYEFYISTPGKLLPPKWERWLPGWSRVPLLGQITWQWIAMVMLLLLWITILVYSNRLLFRERSSLLDSIRLWRQGIFKVFVILMLNLFSHLIDESINFTGSTLYAISTFLTLVNWVLIAIAIIDFTGATAEKIIRSPQIRDNGIRATYIRAISSIIGGLSAISVFVYGLSQVGVSLIPLLSAVGIGGLAIALAARPTIENIIGSLTIFSDKPFRVGERIKVKNYDGVVESIGLRSTRIRNLTGHLTSVPNEVMAKVEIENIGQRPYIKRIFNVTLPYSAKPEQIKCTVDVIEEILRIPKELQNTITAENYFEVLEQNDHKNIRINHPEFPPRVFLKDITEDALSIVILYWYHPPNYWDYLAHASWVNMQIVENLSKAGVNMSIPMQRIFISDETHEDGKE